MSSRYLLGEMEVHINQGGIQSCMCTDSTIAKLFDPSHARVSEQMPVAPGLINIFLACRASDVQLVFLFQGQDSPDADSSVPVPTALNIITDTFSVAHAVDDQNCGTELKACTLQNADVEVRKDNFTISMPAHKAILVLKSAYFDTLPNIDEKTTSVITEHASSAEEVRVMEAVAEFMYTDKLPLYCSSSWEAEMDTRGVYDKPLHILRLMLTVQVRQE